MTATTNETETTLSLIRRFEGGFTPLDVDALMADMTDDCVFEHVAPEAVSFGRHEGQAAVRAVWESMEHHFPGFTMEANDIFASGNRATCVWTMRWHQPDGSQATLRGVDVFTVREGKVARKIMYGTL